jgi:DNA replication protein DnaD
MSGYTLSYRDKWTHPVFRNLLEAGMWSWICDSAAWKKTRVRFNGIMIELERGELATSIRFMASGFGIGEQLTRTFLQNLEKEGMINTRPTHWGTVITICNYDKYQCLENTDNTPINTRPTHAQHTPNTNKNTSNTSNKDNIPDGVSELVWKDFVSHRKAKKSPITKTAMNGIIREAEKAA